MGTGVHAAPDGPARAESESAPPAEPFRGDDDATGDPPKRRDLHSQLRNGIEWVVVAIGALVLALLIKAFLLQAFYIPSASMDPTLREDDRVLVNKLSYRVGDVQRGDIVVFHRPPLAADQGIDDFIKRVIALPGETISFSDGRTYIDGQALSEGYVDTPTTTGQVIPGCDNSPAATDTCRIPDGMVFVMGDNRTGSADSRRFGPIGEDTIIGRAFLKVWPLGDIGFL